MSDIYVKYYSVQAGAGIDEDRFGPLLRFSTRYQKGRGLGGIFSGLMRYLKPIFSSGFDFLKKEAINTGIDLASGISQQKPIKEILRDRSLKIVDNLRDRAAEKINRMTGSGSKLHRRRRSRRLRQNRIKTKNCHTKKCNKRHTSTIKKRKYVASKGIKRKLQDKSPHSKKYRMIDIFS